MNRWIKVLRPDGKTSHYVDGNGGKIISVKYSINCWGKETNKIIWYVFDGVFYDTFREAKEAAIYGKPTE